MDRFLNGGVMGGQDLTKSKHYRNGKVYNLHGKTLKLNAATCTFADAANAGRTFAQIKTAIQAALAGTTVTWQDGHLVVALAAGLTVQSDGTSNPIFGFSSATDMVGTVYNGPAGAVPRWLVIDGGPRMDGYYVVTEVA